MDEEALETILEIKQTAPHPAEAFHNSLIKGEETAFNEYLNAVKKVESLLEYHNYEAAYSWLSSLDEELEKIRQKYSSVRYVDSSEKYLTIVADTELSRKDVKNSEYWRLPFNNLRLIISRYSDNVYQVQQKEVAHPYFKSGLLSVSIPGLVSLYSIIGTVMDYVSHYSDQRLKMPLDHFIGYKCAVSGVYTYGNSVQCSATNVSLHKDVAKVIEGRYYSPDVVRTCSKCNKEVHKWINTNKVITCGACS